MQSENHHLFPKTFHTAPLETWAATIRQQSSEVKQCFLEQVVHYKALSDMEHEFLVVYASHPSGFKIVLGVDRNAQDLATAASKQTSGSASQDTDTTQPSTVKSSSGRYLNKLVWAKSLLLPSSTSSSPPPSSSDLAYDCVQVSHDRTPEPILAQHGPCVPLYMITFSSTSPPLTAFTTTTTSTSTSNSDARRPPSLLHLSVLLLAIRTHFPSYDLLQYQCYFFARVTCLALMDLFGGVEMVLLTGKRAATWRGVHVSLYSAGRKALDMLSFSAVHTALLNMLPFSAGHIALHSVLLLPLVQFPALIVPAGLVVYSVVKIYDGNVVGRVDRRRIR
jgi:hypothetical protein